MVYTHKKRHTRRHRRGGVKIGKRKKTRMGTRRMLPGPSPLRRSETNREAEIERMRELEMKSKIRDAIRKLKESEMEDKLSSWELYEQE
jgi:hypothetical protein